MLLQGVCVWGREAKRACIQCAVAAPKQGYLGSRVGLSASRISDNPICTSDQLASWTDEAILLADRVIM